MIPAGITAVAVSGALVLAGCGSSSGSGSGSKGGGKTVSLAQTSDSLAFAALDIAEAKGYFAKRGISVKTTIVKGDAETIPAVISGRIDFGATTTPPALKAMLKASNLNMVAPLVGNIQQWIASKSAISKAGITPNMSLAQKISRLKGAKVATLDVGGALEDVFNGVVKEAGESPSDYSVTAISPYSSLLVALDRGEVDVGLVAAPYGTENVSQGKAVMLANLVQGGLGSQYDHSAFSSVISNTSYEKSHPAQVKAMHDGINEALHYMHSNPKAAETLLHSKFFSTFPNAVLDQFVSATSKTYPQNDKATPAVFNATRSLTAKFVDPSVSSLSYTKAVWAGAR